MSPFSKIREFFRSRYVFERSTFGLENVYCGPTIIHWRLTDLAYVGLLLVLYPISYGIQPFQRQFYINDLTISHPFSEVERVSNTMLFVYSACVPLVVITIISLIITKGTYKLYVTYTSILGLVISVLTTSLVTDILKNSFGRHRPDFLARCVPHPDAPKDILVYAKDVCTTKNIPRLMDGFRTTPSGHSSISFAGLFFLSLWLAGQLGVTRPHAGALRWATIFIPTLGAALIALGRTEDYRHHFVDVFVGSCIGLVIGSWSYLRLFPSPCADASYEPKIIKKEEEERHYMTVQEV